MSTVKIRDLIIGEGVPAICVPIVGVKEEEILNQAEDIKASCADIAEWRMDWFEYCTNVFEIEKTAEKVRKLLGNIPLLATFRTKSEGGEYAPLEEDYIAVNKAVINYADAIDVELYREENTVKELVGHAHKNGKKVIMSSHDFNKTPCKDEIIKRLVKMQDMGADIAKMAVMPKDKKDLLTLLMATEEMYSEYAKIPIITMSMSKTGVLSRLCGEVFGSALTFGALKKSSAPGQIGAEDLKKILEILHNNI